MINEKPVTPTVRRPDTRVMDVGKVRIGDATITSVSPVVRRPEPKVRDTGRVRYGDATITGVYRS